MSKKDIDRITIFEFFFKIIGGCILFIFCTGAFKASKLSSLIVALTFIFNEYLIIYFKKKIEKRRKERLDNQFAILKLLNKWLYTPEELFKTEYISFSKLDCYSTCPKKFELTYLQKIKPQHISRNLIRGKLLHKLLEVYTKKNLNQFPECLKEKNVLNNIFTFYNLAINEIYTELLPNINLDLYKIFTEDELTVLLSNFIKLNQNRNIYFLFRAYDPFMTQKDSELLLTKPEYNIKVEINDYIFIGFVDRVDFYKNKCVLIDYKTGKPIYTSQLTFYTYLLKYSSDHFFKKNFYSEFQYLKTGEYRRDREQINDYFESHLWATIKRIVSSTEFLPNKSWKCKFCGVRNFCPTSKKQ